MFLHPRLRRQAIMLFIALVAVVAAKLYLSRVADGRASLPDVMSTETPPEPQTVETVPPPPSSSSTTASSP